jgi:error-prone DNA polymerase
MDTGPADFQLRTGLSKQAQRVLAKIGALNGLADHRRDAQWKVEVVRQQGDLFAEADSDAAVPLAPMNPRERTQTDYSGMGLTTGPHPVALIRAQFDAENVWRAVDLEQAKTGMRVRVAGLVICRQRPGTAKGFVFVSLEDETGTANASVTPQLFENCRLLISEEAFLLIEGIVQNMERVIHVKALRVAALQQPDTALPASHDFR